MLLAENLLLALAAAAVGVTVGQLIAPELTNLGNGLLGSPPTPPLTLTSATEVLIVAVVGGRVRHARAGDPRRSHEHDPRTERSRSPAPAPAIADRALGALPSRCCSRYAWSPGASAGRC